MASKRKHAPDDNNGAKVARVKTESKFVDGSILKLKVRDFLTYSECVYDFGPGLNVLLGPNGTGKSSVVCALCLGLAGAQNLLGRAREIGDFVRHGQEEAWIQVDVFRQQGNIRFERHIKRENNISHWKINRQPATLKKVQEAVAQLHIQLDNLCQFLPQDRVVDFARLSPPELLKATEKAVGDASMFNNHEQLIELRKREKDLQVKACRNTEELDRLRHQNSLLDRDVQRYQERQQFMLQVRDLENKRPWVEYEEVRTEFSEARQLVKDAKGHLDQLRQLHEPMRIKQENAKKRAKQLQGESKQAEKLVEGAKSKCMRISQDLEQLDEEMSEPAQRLDTARRQEADRQQKVTTAEQRIEQLQKDIDEVVSPEQLKPQLHEATARLRDVNTRVMRLQQQQTTLRQEQEPQAQQIATVEKELGRLEDVSNRRFQQLRQADRDTFNAVQWLRSNQDRFKQHVFEPVLLVVNMKRAEDSCFFEQVVGYGTLITFVCQNDDDLKLFCQLVRDNQGLRINAAAVPDIRMEDIRKRQQDMQAVRQRYDFRASLLDLIEGPEGVLRFLCGKSRIHETLIGTDRTESNVDRVINESPLTVFCTPKSLYFIKTSHYGERNKSTQVSSIKPGRFLNVAVDTQHRDTLQAELREVREAMENGRLQIEQLRDEERQVRVESANLKKQKDALQAQKDKRSGIDNQLALAKKNLQRYLSQSVDLERVEREVTQALAKTNQKRTETAYDMSQCVKKMLNLSNEKIRLELQRLQLNMLEDFLSGQCDVASTGLKEAEHNFDELEKRSKSLKEQAKQKHRQAKQMLGIREDKPSADVIAVFNKFPSTLIEIDDMIHDLKARADLNYHTDPKVVEEYEKRKEEIEKMEQSLDTEKDDLQGLTTEITEIKEKWLDPLKQLINKINGKYGEFFSKLGCNGEVQLEENDDYDKYAIRILVKFHTSQKLHVLTAQHQSGGERSVATMLYLMALQELTTCPFRVVDEINQGMDPNNERKVFEFVVAAACRPGTSQYFLITPKLLTNLKYTENMKVHCIYSGPEIHQSHNGSFDPHRLVKQLRSAQ
eukprot:scpid19614/ scgid4000/ Structural maintenance of chromosomes protein 5; Protein expressed in male leptotene and zygotene spermatocytes 453